jgi:hypothetical protein
MWASISTAKNKKVDAVYNLHTGVVRNVIWGTPIINYYYF